MRYKNLNDLMTAAISPQHVLSMQIYCVCPLRSLTVRCCSCQRVGPGTAAVGGVRLLNPYTPVRSVIACARLRRVITSLTRDRNRLFRRTR